ncbi:MAG: hypothetical protein ACK5E6_01870 [Cyanobacteriota bacterium]
MPTIPIPQQQAQQNMRRGVSQTFVLVPAKAPAEIAGFYTLAPAEVRLADLQPADARPLPPDPVPCYRMGRLARDQRWQGQGIGPLLLGLAVQRCLDAKRSVGGYALIVDAKDAAEVVIALLERADQLLSGFAAITLLQGNDVEPLRQQVIEIPPITPLVIEHRLHRLQRLVCPCCSTSTCAPIPPDVELSRYGPRLSALVGLLGSALPLSFSKTQVLPDQLLGVEISRGAIAAIRRGD